MGKVKVLGLENTAQWLNAPVFTYIQACLPAVSPRKREGVLSQAPDPGHAFFFLFASSSLLFLCSQSSLSRCGVEKEMELKEKGTGRRHVQACYAVSLFWDMV